MSLDYKYKLVSPHATYYDYGTDEYVPLDFTNICKVSLNETMKPLAPEAILSHPLGVAAVRFSLSAHDVQHVDVDAYAGVTGFEEYQGYKLAVVGAVIAMPHVRQSGLGQATVGTLLESASTDQAFTEYSHLGFMAKCNPNGKKLLQKLGFTEGPQEDSKTIMLKLI